MTTKHTFKENVLRVVAVIGLLAILLLGAWGIIQLAFFISSLFTGGTTNAPVTQTVVRETLTISVPATATAGSATTVSWGHQGGTGAYAYTLSYSCVEGLSFKAPVPTGATQTVACDTPFNYTQANSALALTPVYSGTTDAKTTITVTATKLSSGAITATATGAMTVPATKKATVKPTTTKSPSNTTYVASGRTSNLYGYADLAVAISSVRSQNGNATAQFVVENVGTNVSPSNWSFNAILPINGSYTYPSGPQRALYPGDKIVYTLNFSDYNSNTQYGATNYGTNSLPTGQAGYTYGTCNLYGPCAVPGYSGGCGATPCGYTQPYTNWYPYQPAGNTGYNAQKAVTITVDPNNQVFEGSKYNNSATATYISY